MATPDDGGGGSEIVIPRRWSEAAEAIASSTSFPPVAVICGPKNSGKSTFSRYLLNSLLRRHERVGYLDTDVGQPEFGLPGCLSLHIVDEQVSELRQRPWFVRDFERCFFFGDVSSKRDPQTYLSSAFALYDCFMKELGDSSEPYCSRKPMVPLIINTPGWVKGMGFDLLVDMLRYINPTHVVQIRISVEWKNLPTGPFWLDREQEGSVELIDIPSARKDSLNRSLLIKKDARGIRDQRLFQYFIQCIPSNAEHNNKELARALVSLPPYEVPFLGIRVMHLHCQVPVNEIFHSLNATIVGLAVNSEGHRVSQMHPPPCLGLGIVRGVDARKGMLYVLTPVPPASLKKVNLLLHGLVQIPTCLLQVHGYVSPYMSTNVLHNLPNKERIESNAE